jgi:DNA-binding MarR family transcriptional regulator
MDGSARSVPTAPAAPSGTRSAGGRDRATAVEEPLAVFTQLSRAGLLLEALQKDSLGTFELSFVEYSVLRILDRAGEGRRQSPSRLAEQVVRTTGAMTKILDRLERRRLVERIPDPADRRALLVGLTDDGLELSRKASAAYTVLRTQVLAGLAADELATMTASVRRLVQLLEHNQTRPGGRAP